MKRERISTTVDSTKLAAARRLLDANDANLVDRALEALIEELEGEREAKVLEMMPYDQDPDLSWEVPGAAGLPYDGVVPDDVKRLAATRRRR